jgi:hypothetical protein
MTESERHAVEIVCEQYFPIADDGQRHNNRADREIERMQSHYERLAEAGRKGGLIGGKARPKPGLKPGLSISTSTSTSTEEHPQPDEESASGKPKRKPRAPKLADDADWLKTIREQYAKLGIDVDREVIKAKAWLTGPNGRKRQFTQSFLLNWLARADRIITGTQGNQATPATVAKPNYRDLLK